jgi:TonB-dependent receptor
MVPGFTVNSTTRIININNPDLRAQYGNSFDVSVEYYLKPVGLLSAGVFMKKLSDFIYTVTGEVIESGQDNGFDGAYAGYTLNYQDNGPGATIKGLELSYQQTLAFLPKPFNGLSVNLNYTLLDMDADYDDGSGAPSPTNDIQGFIPSTANARLRYNYKKFGVGVSYNYTDSKLLAYSTDHSRLQYRKSRFSIGVDASFKFQRFMEFFVTVGNLTNEPYVNYRGIESRRQLTIYNGPYVNIGMSGRF